MKRSLSIESESQQTRHSAVSENNASGIQAFADNRESAAAQRQLMTVMANSPQAVAQRKISQLMNNNPRMLVQRKMLFGTSNKSVQLAQSEKKVMQMVNVGFIPTNPAIFRRTTTIVGSIGTTMAGNKAFNNSQRPYIYANNVNNGGGNAPVVGPGQHPTDDWDNGALIDRNVVTPIEPEIDHIVKREDGGANDYGNARVLSKSNNTNGNPTRPSRANQILRLYQNITLSANIPRNNQPNFVYAPVQINAGTALDDTQAILLAFHAGIGGINGVAALSGSNVDSIIAAGRNTQNHVTVT